MWTRFQPPSDASKPRGLRPTAVEVALLGDAGAILRRFELGLFAEPLPTPPLKPVHPPRPRLVPYSLRVAGRAVHQQRLFRLRKSGPSVPVEILIEQLPCDEPFAGRQVRKG